MAIQYELLWCSLVSVILDIRFGLKRTVNKTSGSLNILCTFKKQLFVNIANKMTNKWLL